MRLFRQRLGYVSKNVEKRRNDRLLRMDGDHRRDKGAIGVVGRARRLRFQDRLESYRLVAQTAVPILPDDTARDVFAKVTVAAEIALDGVLPALMAGTAVHRPQDLSRGSYFGGRRPEDGRIDWKQPARAIHDLVRAVAPPYPGAWFEFMGLNARLLRTQVVPASGPARESAILVRESDRLVVHCRDGGVLRIIDVECDGIALDAVSFSQRFGRGPHLLS